MDRQPTSQTATQLGSTREANRWLSIVRALGNRTILRMPFSSGEVLHKEDGGASWIVTGSSQVQKTFGRVQSALYRLNRWIEADAQRSSLTRTFGVLLSLLLTLVLLLPAFHRPDIGQTDLMRFYRAATLLRSGVSPYDMAGITRLQLAHGLHTEYVPLDYVYPPFFGEILIPLTVLPVALVFHLWILVLAASIAGSLILLSAIVCGRVSWRLVLVALPLALLLRPMRDELLVGNVDPVLLLCLCASYWAYRQGYIRRSALFLAVAVAIKPFLGILFLFYLWKGAYSLCVWAAGIIAVFVVLPFLPIGMRGFSDWMQISSFESGPNFAWIAYNQSPYGLAVRLFSTNPFTVPIAILPWLPRVIMLACAAVVLFVLTRLIPRHDQGRAPTSCLLDFLLALVAPLLISPLTEHLHMTTLIAPLFVLAILSASMTRSSRMWVLGGLVAIYSLFTLPQIYMLTTLSTGHPQGVAIFQTSFYLCGVLATFVILALVLRRANRVE